MSTISLKEFMEKAVQDPELGKKIAALFQEHNEKVRALVAQEGYELNEGMQPLSDEEAASAAGGGYETFDWNQLYETAFLGPVASKTFFSHSYLGFKDVSEREANELLSKGYAVDMGNLGYLVQEDGKYRYLRIKPD